MVRTPPLLMVMCVVSTTASGGDFSVPFYTVHTLKYVSFA